MMSSAVDMFMHASLNSWDMRRTCKPCHSGWKQAAVRPFPSRRLHGLRRTCSSKRIHSAISEVFLFRLKVQALLYNLSGQ